MLSAATGFQKSFYLPRRISPELWTLDRVLLATRGRVLLLSQSNQELRSKPFGKSAQLRDINFKRISTDSRTLSPGDLFITLHGANFDGIDFIQKAIKKGATGILVNREDREKAVASVLESISSVPHCSIPVILVDDTQTALGDLAAYRRSLMHNLKVVAITGSSGKTTVKEMTATILSQKCNTNKTKRNFNNLIGLPLTLFGVESQHEFSVLEMGMNSPGEICRLTEIADPDIGVIVNVHPAHLEGLGSIQGVAKAKQELFTGMKSWSTLVINYDDPIVRKMAKQYRQKKISYAATSAGRRHGAFIKATHAKTHGSEGLSFTLHIGSQQKKIHLETIGTHNINNALAAAALAHAAGLSIRDIAKGLHRFTGFEKRTQLLTDSFLGLHILNDSYNANPASMQAAIETTVNLKKNNRAVAVLGDMFELGDYSIDAHRQLGKSIALSGITYLAATGEFAAETVAGAQNAGMAAECTQIFKDKKEITSWLQMLNRKGNISRGDWLLIKGSRGMKMESVLLDLEQGATA